MGEDLLFRMILALAMGVTRLTHPRTERTRKTRRTAGESAVKLAFYFWTASIIVYVAGIGVRSATIPLAVPARLGGALVAFLCIFLSAWINRTLGKQFSTNLEILKDHRLIMSGPYKFVRHPRYAVFFLFAVAMSIASANIFIALASITAAVTLIPRIRDEESMLLEHFGEQYRRYMRSTGAIIPKWRWSSA